MIDRQAMGLLPDKPHTTLRDNDGKLFYEEMHTRGGFGGPFTYFYHRHPVTAHTETAPSDRGYAPPRALDPRVPLRRRLFQTGKVEGGGQLLDCRVPILFNAD